MPPDRATLRRAARSARRAVVGGARERAEQLIVATLVERLDGLAHRDRPGRVALSLPTDGEVDLRPLAPQLRARGWELHLPVVDEGGGMTFRSWQEGARMAPNRFGIPEPVDGGPVVASSLDVVLLPCVAVDRRGHRLGFGAGYYDRALAEAPTGGPPIRIGAAFDVQVVPEVPARHWDVPLHGLVTESGWFAAG